ncbi:hypothetical protein FRC12_024303 [Ceratobasidium sp. 428]|nr:hypothetical protein FRC12_024303 [Ceratobasidium sp. 428]
MAVGLRPCQLAFSSENPVLARDLALEGSFAGVRIHTLCLMSISIELAMVRIRLHTGRRVRERVDSVHEPQTTMSISSGDLRGHTFIPLSKTSETPMQPM